MTRPAYNPLEMYRFKSSAFPFTSSATVDANVLTIESVDATDAIAAAALAGLGKGSTLTEAGGTGDQLTALGDTRLANLDAAVSTRQATISGIAMAVATVAKLDTTLVQDGAVYDFTAAALAAGPTGGTPLTAQQTRDAMKLAPTDGAPDAGSVDKQIDDIQTKTDQLNFTGTDVKATLDGEEVTPTTASKTGYALAANGLDAITADEPTSKPTNFREWLMWLVQYKRRGTKSATQIIVKTEAGDVVTTQAISANGNDQTLGPPS